MSRDLPALVAQLDLVEKTTLLAGADIFSMAPLERHGIPPVRVTDGPNGARGTVLPGAAHGQEPLSATCGSCGAALGATWDTGLVERIGALVGRQTRTKACRVLLAPTVNLHRSPLGGRNFESYSRTRCWPAGWAPRIDAVPSPPAWPARSSTSPATSTKGTGWWPTRSSMTGLCASCISRRSNSVK